MKELTEDDISIISSGEPNLWRTTITIYDDNSLEQAIQVKQKILHGLAVKRRIEEKIKKCDKMIEFWQNKLDSIDYENPETWNGYDSYMDLQALCRATINDEELSKSQWQLLLGSEKT